MPSSHRFKLIATLYVLAVTWFVALAATALSVADAVPSTLGAWVADSAFATTVATMAPAILVATAVTAGLWLVFQRFTSHRVAVHVRD